MEHNQTWVAIPLTVTLLPSSVTVKLLYRSMMHLALLKNLIVILNEIYFSKNNQTHFSSVAGVHHTLRLPSESHCLNNHIGQSAVEQKKRLKMFLSDPSQIITLPCHSVIPCSCLFLFQLLDLSKLLLWSCQN